MYSSSTSEGVEASDYFNKWGWYATLDNLAGGDILKHKEVLNTDCYEMHTFLAHSIDKSKLEALLRKKPINGKVTRI